MITTIGRAILILALCLSIGLQWLALQSVAWTAMLVANVRHSALTEAVAKTFDGSHPCDLCHFVSTGKKSEKKSDVLPASAKMDLFCTQAAVALPPASVDYEYVVCHAVGQALTLAPPTPPPRSVPGLV